MNEASIVSTKPLNKKITSTLVRYLKTQFMVVIITGLVSWLILSLLGVRFALLLGFITGAFVVVPMIGMITAAILASISAAFDGIRFLVNIPEIFEGLVVLIVYTILNILVDYFLSPYLLGKVTKIHPVILFLAVIVGAGMFGFVGALLAAPAVLVVKTILDHNRETQK